MTQLERKMIMITTNATQSLIDYIYNLDKKTNLNIIDTFWLMHGNFDNVPQRPINMAKLIDQASTNYENVFDSDTSNFIDTILENLYEHLDTYILESKKYTKDVPILNTLKDIFTDITQWIAAYKKFTEEFKEILKELNNYNIAWSLNKDDNKDKAAYRFTNYHKIKAILEDKFYLNKPFEDPHLYRLLKTGKINNKYVEGLEKANKKWLNDKYNEIRNKLIRVFNSSDNDFIEARRVLNDKMSYTLNILIQMEYALHDIFKYELITIYLFTGHKLDKAPATKALCNKQEAFFNKIYNLLIEHKKGIIELFNCFCHRAHKESAGIYYPFSPEVNTPITFFQLFKIIRLYQIFEPDMQLDDKIISKQIQNNKSVKSVLSTYYRLFQQSNLMYPCYSKIASEPALSIMKDLSLTQKEVADYLGISERSLSGKIRNGKLTSDHPWFWLVISGATYEFLEGLTTLPWYGRNINKEKSSPNIVSPVMIGAYAEEILKKIQSFSTYNKNLGYNKDVPKIQALSLPLQAKIGSYMSQIATLIFDKKRKIEKELTYKRRNVIQNHEDNPSDGTPPKEIPLLNSDNYRELVNILDDTISALKKSLHNGGAKSR